MMTTDEDMIDMIHNGGGHEDDYSPQLEQEMPTDTQQPEPNLPDADAKRKRGSSH